MTKQWLSWLNWGFIGLAAFFVIAALVLVLLRPSEIPVTDTINTKRPLPNVAFAMPKSSYDLINSSVCELKFSPMTLQLPDLRNHLIYYGKNGRPDAQVDHPVVHIAFTHTPGPTSVATGERLYLVYDRKRNPPQYASSPGNIPTSLWLEFAPHGNEVAVKIKMHNEKGEEVTEPAANAQFNLPEKESLRNAGRHWELGKWRVDGSLLARQKARWMGADLFLERHGGDEFQELKSKHRVDFADEETVYSVYVSANDSLVWDQGKWRTVQPGKDSLAYPLMVLKKIDDRIMSFELWDVGGKAKMPITLVKINEPWMPQNLQDKFQFLGARTRSQYIFEIEGQRMLISPKDWLLQTEDGWIKLASVQQIDDYVDRKLTGVLFVVDGVVRKEGRQVLEGMLFNTGRTEMQEVEIPVQQIGRTPLASSTEEADDDDDDDEDEDGENEDIEETERGVRMRLPERANIKVIEPAPSK